MTKLEPGRNLVAVVGVAGIVILEAIALYMKINGQLFSTALGCISLIVGYAFGYRAATSK